MTQRAQDRGIRSNFNFSATWISKIQEPELMKISSMLLLLVSVLSSLARASHSTTVLVDGTSGWTNPIVHVGDSIVFKHKYHYNLFIFQNQRAFNLCNFNLSTLLTKLNSTSYTWHPSRPGFYYFAFHNGSLNSCNQHSQKLAIKVSPAPPQLLPTPQPISGGVVVPSSPAYPWPFRPREAAVSSPAPMPSNARSPSVQVADKGDGSIMPFINSNPAVPLPTGEIDSATIRPLPTSGNNKQVEGLLLGGHKTLFRVLLLLLLLRL